MNFRPLSPPDGLFVLDDTSPGFQRARPIDSGRLVWDSKQTRIVLRAESPHRLAVSLSSGEPVRRVVLRWKHRVAPCVRILGDAWERTYGDIEWRGPSPHRLLPWYFLATEGSETAGWGVETGARALACWRVDVDGITLELDVRSGGAGVVLGSRTLEAVTIIDRPSQPGETPFAATCALCRDLSPAPLMPRESVVGHNDWYWLYGKNSAQVILDATRRLLDIYPTGSGVPRPWSVIDDGWEVSVYEAAHECPGGPWQQSNGKFPDMAAVAADIKSLGARPGIWMRPLCTYASVPDEWKLPKQGPVAPTGGHRLDPSVPAVLELVREDIACLRDWGYELIKHDFSTYDASGRWGFEMQAKDGFTADGWAFADRTRTTAEILLDLYRTIRKEAGPEVLILGCNTVSHLAAGLVEIQRTGDDTSASDWDRTRRMGVNTLAFRAAQQGSFYAVDADCVPISPQIPWRLTEAWLKLVASSGTPLFLSIDPSECGPEQTAALKAALKTASKPGPVAEPLDWLDTPVPSRWKLSGREEQFEWSEWDIR